MSDVEIEKTKRASVPPPLLIRGCMEGLKWAWELPATVPMEPFILELREKGFRDQSHFDWIWVLENEQEHKIIIVPKTRRIEIRIHYLTEKEKRELTAWKIAFIMHQACEYCSS